MKRLLLLVALSAPIAALAQQPESGLLRALAGKASGPHGYFLAHKALLYADTLTSRPAHHLRPGDDVIVRQMGKRWIQVVRGNGKGTSFSTTDGTIYYLPVEAVKDARIFVLI